MTSRVASPAAMARLPMLKVELCTTERCMLEKTFS